MIGKGVSKGKVRQDAILQLLKQQGRITVQDILAQFHCSEATARRDLEALEELQGVIRTIGGAIYDGMWGVPEVSFAEKKGISWLEKEKIAARAITLIQEGEVIGLSGGTTTYLIARALKNIRGITVVTNAVNIAMELADADDIQVVVTGGVMRKKSFELCGPLSVQVIESLNISKMFLGIDGLSVAQGITTFSELEAQMAKMLMNRSVQTYAVFDASKIERASLFSIAPLSSLNGCITNTIPSQTVLEELQKHNVEIHFA